MLTRKSGILALVLGAAFLGACEQKAPVVNVDIPTQTPAVTVTISPNPVPQLKKGQTVQLVAAVANATGNNQAVTWSVVSGSNVASVSSTGLVTANAPGVAVVKAVSVADATASSSVAISVQDTTTGTTGPQGQPSITINSVTQFGTTFPVNPGNVNGTIDVTMNVDIPAGVSASAVRVTLDGTEVCRQAFASGTSADASVEAAPQVIVCSINTARLGTNGVAAFLNGVHTLKAEVLGATGSVIASATYQPLTFNNTDALNVVVTTSKGPAADQNNLSWRGGDVVFTVQPAIYSGNNNNVTSLTLTATNSAAAAIEGGDPSCATTGRALPLAGCAVGSIVLAPVTTSANNTYTITLPASSTWASGKGVGNIEDPNLTFALSGLTAAGQNFGGVQNLTFNNAVLTNPGGTNQLRLDNLAPRVTLLDVTPATLGCAPNAACYVNGSFSLTTSASTYSSTSVASGFSRTVDYGVDKQTITFAAGPSSSTLVAFTSPSTLAETQVANTNLLQATVVDALANSRTVYASTTAATPVTSSTSASIQKFGVDLTPPTITAGGSGNGVRTVGADSPAATANTFTFSASDAGVGPSAIKQFNIKVEQITPAGTTCLTPAGGLFAGTGSCTTAAAGVTAQAAAGNPAAATVTLPDASAYYRITVTAQDYAGNTSTVSTQVQLRDFVPPTVGGMATPSSIQGNTSVSFTAPMADDVELGDVTPTIGYNEGGLVNVFLANPARQIGTWGFDVFSNTDAGTFTVNNFIRSIETTAAGVPTNTISRATLVQADVRDMAGLDLNTGCPTAGAGDGVALNNCYQRQANILPAVQFGMNNAAETSFGSANRPFGTGVNNQGTSWQLTTSAGAAPAANTNVCSNNPVGANAGCNVVTKTTMTFFAQAQGPSQTFAAPFPVVNFYATDPVSGRSYQVCTSGAPTAVDNTVNNTRTWTYSCTWAPQTQTTIPNAAGVYQAFALGIDSTGRALMTQNQQVTLTSD